MQPKIELVLLDGDQEVLLASASADQAGQAAILQTVATHGGLAVPGQGAPPKTYLVRVDGVGGSTGSYEVKVVLNAAKLQSGIGPPHSRQGGIRKAKPSDRTRRCRSLMSLIGV